MLETHLVPHGPSSAIWKDDYEAFAKERIESIFREIDGTISPLEVELENNPVMVLDRLEAELRTHIDGVLTEQLGEQYWDVIPQGTRELVEKRLAERLRRHAYERNDAATNYQRLTFCDIMDYAQIILKNWQIFEGVFGSRGEVERHFLNLKEYRNALKHAREMNTVERKQGEASVEWLFRILERARQEAAFSEEGVLPVGTPELNGQNEREEDCKDKTAPTIEGLLAKVQDPSALERIKEMMRFCEALPNAERYTTRHHIVYRTNRAFAKIYPQRFQFWVDVIRTGVADPRHLLKHKHPVHGHIEVPTDLDLQKVKDLVQQSYKTTVKIEAGAN